MEDTTCTETESIISSRQGKYNLLLVIVLNFVSDVFVIVNVACVLCICVHKGTKLNNTLVCTGISISCDWMVYDKGFVIA